MRFMQSPAGTLRTHGITFVLLALASGVALIGAGLLAASTASAEDDESVESPAVQAGEVYRSLDRADIIGNPVVLTEDDGLAGAAVVDSTLRTVDRADAIANPAFVTNDFRTLDRADLIGNPAALTEDEQSPGAAVVDSSLRTVDRADAIANQAIIANNFRTVDRADTIATVAGASGNETGDSRVMDTADLIDQLRNGR